MSKPVISIENLSKQYYIGTYGVDDLREQIAHTFSRLNPFGRSNDSGEEEKGNTIWALKDINLEVQQGEILGIIGHNGAGKSTLLKILSRITYPTTGRIEINGRVASLLEVGTGFHPELTGRENVYMNAAILGMKRAEIKRKFDEIVDFAEVEKFIDTPVKRYSSGMYTRLAFAVAAHLDPEILIVDEVLSVGDASFQKKSLGKMDEVAKGGRTVLFVSHNMGAISNLCKRVVLLDSGKIAIDGKTEDVVQFYQTKNIIINSDGNLDSVQRSGSGKVRFRSIKINPTNKDGTDEVCFYPGGGIEINLSVTCHKSVSNIMVAIIVYDASGLRLIDANTALQGGYFDMQADEEVKITFRLEDVLLRPGEYLIGLWIGRENTEEMDVITYAQSLAIDIDPTNTRHSREFPGIYKCRFSYSMK